jgi:uncharacterized protein (TIGR00725 family)
MSAITRLPIVGVMGSGVEPHHDKAVPLGRWLARRRVHLLTGGGAGVMAAVSRAFAETVGRAGLVIGVIPSQDDSLQPQSGYPNPWVELPIRTHLPLSGLRGAEPLSRNHINVLTSDVIIALPGAAGTSNEVRLALLYQRPIAAYLDSRNEIPDLPGDVPVCTTLQDVQRFIAQHIR